MRGPLVSVIVPAYRNADFLGEAVQSVLDQTYPNFEVIVVNDASPDHTREVVSRFSDPRVKYIVHPENRGLSATRNTGIRASSGNLIALLDGDDFFHREKLQRHVEFHSQHPTIGVTYNARFELNHSSTTIRELWRPPLTVTFADLAQGFPFSPSDMVLRRNWAFRVNLFDERCIYFGEDLDINCRLALAGCEFASVDRALNYRRYHTGRTLRNLPAQQESELRPLFAIFDDPRQPAEVLALRNVALASGYLRWTILAFNQGETTLGQQNCATAIELDRSILTSKPNRLVEFMLAFSIIDESADHARLLETWFDQLPLEVDSLREQREAAVARGYLLRAGRAAVWGNPEIAREHFAKAVEFGATVDQSYLRHLAAHLLSYETEFGSEATFVIAERLGRHLAEIGHATSARWLKGCYLAGRAFLNFQARRYSKVPGGVIRTIANDPGYLTNRGLIAILIRSMVGHMRHASIEELTSQDRLV